MPWLRRTFLAGFFFTVPLFVSLAALVWIFGIIDGFTAPVATRIPGPVGRTSVSIVPGAGANPRCGSSALSRASTA